MAGDLEVPNRKDLIVGPDGRMTSQFARFMEELTEVLNHVAIIDEDPSGSLEVERKTLAIRQDGAGGSTLYINEVGDGTSAGWRAL